ncbi:hypothetical protein JCM19379_27580 [Methyloparacoccus murrellii]
MREADRDRCLRTALRVFGWVYLVGVPVLMLWLWPSGWGWNPPQPKYEHMIMGVYSTLGVFLLRAARDPAAHASLIWFTIASNIVHGAIMLGHALVDETERANLVGDVPALFLVAGVLWYLMPVRQEAAHG